MQFHSKNATGKAGERFVETFVEEELKWAYRKAGEPDIGIDGEIEILGRNRASSGGLIKVQVKTTEKSLKGQRIRVPFDEAHLDYFASLNVPPILAVVSLADRQLWWKPILHKSHHKGPRGGFRVILDPKSDRMTAFSGAVLRMIGQRSNAIIAKYLIKEVAEELEDMDELRRSGNYDIVSAESWAQTIRDFDPTMRDAECLLRYERRYSAEITAIEALFADVAERIRDWKGWFEEGGMKDLLTPGYWGEE